MEVKVNGVFDAQKFFDALALILSQREKAKITVKVTQREKSRTEKSRIEKRYKPMNQRATSGHKIWLFDLAHGNLKDDEEILKGFIKYYVLCGCRLDEVIDDIVYRTQYDPTGVKEKLVKVLEKVANGSAEQGDGNGSRGSNRKATSC